MAWRVAAAIGILVIGASCTRYVPVEREEEPQRPGAGGAPGTGGTGGSAGAATGGAGGEGGTTQPPIPIGADPLGCDVGGPARRPAAGTLLADPDAPFRMPPLQEEVEHYRLELAPEVLEALDRNPRSDEERPARFIARGGTWDVLVRYRGNSSRGWPKKSWRVEFPEGTLFDGRRKLNLLAQWKDHTMLVEKMGYDLLAAMHVPAPRAKFVRLTVNGQYRGVFLDLERVDKDFVRNHGFPDKDPDIYRCGRKDCEMKLWREEFQTPFEKKTNETEVTGWLDAFLCAVNAAREPDLVDVLEERIELEIHLRTMVMDALLSNDVVEDSRSYLVFDGFTGRALYVPWDLNNSTTKWQPGSGLGSDPEFEHPLFLYSALDPWSEAKWLWRLDDDPSHRWHPLSSNLNNRIVFHPELRERLLDRLEQALEQLFRPDVMHAWLDANHALIEPHVHGDPEISVEHFLLGPTYLRKYVATRIPFLRREIARMRALPRDLQIVQVDPAAGTVVLGNLGDTPIYTGTAVLSTNLRRRPLVPNVPGRTLAPGETMEVHLATLGLELDPLGELAVWATSDANSLRDLLFVGGLRPGETYQRDADGRWTIR